MVLGDAMSSFDHYAVARKLMVLLQKQGYSSEAKALALAMAEGATGTEVFMALRFRLANVIERVPLAGETKKLALELFEKLNDSLE